jgi:hypothetical protein
METKMFNCRVQLPRRSNPRARVVDRLRSGCRDKLMRFICVCRLENRVVVSGTESGPEANPIANWERRPLPCNTPQGGFVSANFFQTVSTPWETVPTGLLTEPGRDSNGLFVRFSNSVSIHYSV